MKLATAAEFVKSGITGHTFREISEKFGKPFNRLADDDPVMGNFAIAFAVFRVREHLPVPDAFEKAMSLTNEQIEGLFEPETAETKAVADFVSPPSTTTP